MNDIIKPTGLSVCYYGLLPKTFLPSPASWFGAFIILLIKTKLKKPHKTMGTELFSRIFGWRVFTLSVLTDTAKWPAEKSLTIYSLAVWVLIPPHSCQHQILSISFTVPSLRGNAAIITGIFLILTAKTEFPFLKIGFSDIPFRTAAPSPLYIFVQCCLSLWN